MWRGFTYWCLSVLSLHIRGKYLAERRRFKGTGGEGKARREENGTWKRGDKEGYRKGGYKLNEKLGVKEKGGRKRSEEVEEGKRNSEGDVSERKRKRREK